MLFSIAPILLFCQNPQQVTGNFSNSVSEGKPRLENLPIVETNPPTITENCVTSFMRRIGNQGINEELFCLIPFQGDYFLLGGRENDHSILLLLDRAGNIIDQRAFNFTTGDDFISTLMVDKEGYLVGIARDKLNADAEHVYFRYDWQGNSFLWTKLTLPNSFIRMDGVYENPINGNFAFHGGVFSTIDNYLFEMDRNTGAQTWSYTSDYGGNADVLISNFVTNSGVYFAGEGRLGTGLDLLRPTLSKFDFNGNLLWSKMHLRSPTEPSRLYNMDLLVENNSIINIGRGSLNDEDLTNSVMLFYKTNLNGDLIWAKSYSIPNASYIAGINVEPIPSGYIAQGTFVENGSNDRMFIARLDKDGNVVWAKKINTVIDLSGLPKPVALVSDSFVVVASQTKQFDTNGNSDLLFGKLRLDGQSDLPGCSLFGDLVLNSANIGNPYDEMVLPQANPTGFATMNHTVGILNSNLMVNDIPNCECQSVQQDSCNLQLTFLTEITCPFAFDGTITVVPNGGLPPFTYTWQNDTVLSNQLSGLDVGTYAVTVTDENGCVVVDSVQLGAATRPEVSSEVQAASCFGINDGTLTLITDDPSLLFSFQGSTPSSQTFYDSLWGGGDQYFIIDTFGCEWVQFFLIDVPDKISIQLPNSIEAPMCDSVRLNASSSTSPLTWTWSPSDDLSCSDCPDPFANPFSTTTYYLTVQDSNGCKARDSILVRVNFEGQAFVPNAFSPNDDGINDVFYVLGKCISEVKLLRVFDRWGEMVFEKSNTLPNDPLYGWDGKFKEKAASSDVYVYFAVIMLPDGRKIELKGDLTLLR